MSDASDGPLGAKPRAAGRVGAVLAAVLTAGACGPLLGGLEEGRARDALVDAAVHSEADVTCTSWLSGWRARSPYVIGAASQAVSAYQVRLSIDTAALVQSGRMRDDGADLRVTAADGVTVLPHWIERDLGTTETVVWTRSDVGREPTKIYVYYGRKDAPDVSSRARTFVGGVIDDPSFDEGAWAALGEQTDAPTSTTHHWSAKLGGGKATLRLVRPADQNGGDIAVCQTMLFPAGSSYRLVFDLDITLADKGQARIALDGTNFHSNSIYESGFNSTIGTRLGVETRDIAPGTQTVCLAAFVNDDTVGQGVELTYSALRLRRVIEGDPEATPAGAEETACP